MSRFLLDDELSKRISKELPNLEELQHMIYSLRPTGISMNFHWESNVPIAAVCFQDVIETLEEAVYALSEFYAHKIWYSEKREPPNEVLSTFYSRFYLNDVAFRLYSAGEHLANAIIFMLDLSDEQVKIYREKKVSQQSVVGNYLLKEAPGHPITSAVQLLAKSTHWQNTRNYRDRIVHDQPPTVEGLGIVYKRKKRWKERFDGTVKTMILGFGSTGDQPEYALDEILGFIQPALFEFIEVAKIVLEHYLKLLESHNITLLKSGGLQVKFF